MNCMHRCRSGCRNTTLHPFQPNTGTSCSYCRACRDWVSGSRCTGASLSVGLRGEKKRTRVGHGAVGAGKKTGPAFI
ncbi:hypothetical protein FCM35_KLT02399 [Carex littledalei]|uniref:Uncharacterized protein n=1 Tax=Carex littledalei TaxID=544730 RepID=A0A833R3W5_9POAL|nr:hypothetical protein FCM35_KLT02399 [Carex littledalei]